MAGIRRTGDDTPGVAGDDARRIQKIGTWYKSPDETLFNLGLPPNRKGGQRGLRGLRNRRDRKTIDFTQSRKEFHRRGISDFEKAIAIRF